MPHFKRLLFKHDTSLCKRPSFERPFFKQMSTVIGSDCCSHVHVRDREDAATRSDDCTYRSSAALIACCEAAACQAAGHDAPSRFPPLSSRTFMCMALLPTEGTRPEVLRRSWRPTWPRRWPKMSQDRSQDAKKTHNVICKESQCNPV